MFHCVPSSLNVRRVWSVNLLLASISTSRIYKAFPTCAVCVCLFASPPQHPSPSSNRLNCVSVGLVSLLLWWAGEREKAPPDIPHHWQHFADMGLAKQRRPVISSSYFRLPASSSWLEFLQHSYQSFGGCRKETSLKNILACFETLKRLFLYYKNDVTFLHIINVSLQICQVKL